MRPGLDVLVGFDRLQADQLQPVGGGQPEPGGKPLADEIRLLHRHHPAKPHIVGRGAAVELAMGDMALLDAQHVERLDPIGADFLLMPGIHDRIGNRFAVTCRHSKLVGEFAGEGDAEEPRLQPAAKRDLPRGKERKRRIGNVVLHDAAHDDPRLRPGQRHLRPPVRRGNEADVEFRPEGLGRKFQMSEDFGGIGRRRGHHKVVFGKPACGAVVKDDPVLAQHQPVTRSSDRQLQKPVRINTVEEFGRTAPEDLDLAKRGDVA